MIYAIRWAIYLVRLNMLELVLPEDVLEANRELLEIARLSHVRMQNLVDSLLDIAQLDAGRPSGERKPTHLADLMEEVMQLNAFALDKREMTLKVAVPTRFARRMGGPRPDSTGAY